MRFWFRVSSSKSGVSSSGRQDRLYHLFTTETQRTQRLHRECFIYFVRNSVFSVTLWLKFPCYVGSSTFEVERLGKWVKLKLRNSNDVPLRAYAMLIQQVSNAQLQARKLVEHLPIHDFLDEMCYGRRIHDNTKDKTKSSSIEVRIVIDVIVCSFSLVIRINNVRCT